MLKNIRPFFYKTEAKVPLQITREIKNIPIEERDQEEVLYQNGIDNNSNLIRVRVSSPGSKALNPSFDVTPAKYITGIITEKGIIKAHNMSVKKLMEE